MDHSANTIIDAQVTYEYQLDTLNLAVGKHAKVTSADTGGWKLFMRTTIRLGKCWNSKWHNSFETKSYMIIALITQVTQETIHLMATSLTKNQIYRNS
jgi:hypothetical protein